MSMTLKQHVDHWVNSSEENMKDMSAALRSKRRANALYSGHQALEKILKAVLAAQNKEIAHVHKLLKLQAIKLRASLPDKTPASYPENSFN